MKGISSSGGKWFISTFIVLICYPVAFNGQPIQEDSLRVNQVILPQVIPGNPSDGCRDSASWEPISQVWIPWGYNASLRKVHIVPFSDATRINIYNIYGMPDHKLDLCPDSRNGPNDISVENLPDGIYLVVCESRGHQEAPKLMVF